MERPTAPPDAWPPRATEEAIAEAIYDMKPGVMPPWEGREDAARKRLATEIARMLLARFPKFPDPSPAGGEAGMGGGPEAARLPDHAVETLVYALESAMNAPGLHEGWWGRYDALHDLIDTRRRRAPGTGFGHARLILVGVADREPSGTEKDPGRGEG